MNPLYKVIVLDDEPHARELIIAYLERLPDFLCVASCSNAMQGLQAIQSHRPDLVFLDIQMPEMSGLELLALSIPHRPDIILTTAFENYALQSYEFSVLDYLVKPISFDRFVRAVVKFREKYQTVTPSIAGTTASQNQVEINPHDATDHSGLVDVDSVWLREEKRLLQIPYHDIFYVEGLKDYVKVYTHDQLIVSHMTLGKAERSFPTPQFIRIHKSYIVRRGAIRLIDGNMVVLINGNKLPIGPLYRENLKRYISFLE